MTPAASVDRDEPDGDASEARPDRAIILAITAFVSFRVVVSMALSSLPDLEQGYADLAQALLQTDRRIDIYASPAYGLALVAGKWLSHGSLVVASHGLFVTFSCLYGWAVYRLVASSIGYSAACHVLVIATALPLLTVAVVGYSHVVVVGVGLLALCVGLLWDLLSKPTWAGSIAVGLCAFLTAAVRPELHLQVLALLGVSAWHALHAARKIAGRSLVAVALAFVTYAVGTLAEYRWLAVHSSSDRVGIAGDARYSYRTYTHTLSLRQKGTIDDALARELSERAFGSAAGNHYSIVQAMLANPREAALSLIFNAKELLKYLGHPLFLPVFMYPLIGVGFFAWPSHQRWLSALLGAISAPTVVQLLLFHVEVRYMLPLSIPSLVLCGAGLARLTPLARTRTTVVLAVALLLVSVGYIMAFRADRGLGWMSSL